MQEKLHDEYILSWRRNHFHLVQETPNANLVEGMHWLLNTYTIRLNPAAASK